MYHMSGTAWTFSLCQDLIPSNIDNSLVDRTCWVDDDFAVPQYHRRSCILVGHCSDCACHVSFRIHDPDVGRSVLVETCSVDRRGNFLLNLVEQGYPLVSAQD
jgi:hypothetical protein